MSNSKYRLFLTFLFFSTLITGCSNSDAWKAETHPVTGKLIINGSPAVGALVQLHPKGSAIDSRESIPGGYTKIDGTFKITTYKINDGTAPGEYAITIIWPFEGDPQSDRLKGQFATPTKSPTSVLVSKGPNQLPEISLNNVKVESKNKKTTGNIPMPAAPE